MLSIILTVIVLLAAIILLYDKSIKEQLDDPENDKIIFETAIKRRSLMLKALRNCSKSIDKAKAIVIGLMQLHNKGGGIA